MKRYPLTRRFAGAALVLGLFVVASAAGPPSTNDPLRPIPDRAWDAAKGRHLLFRAGFGGTPEEVARLHALGLNRAVDALVDDRPQPDIDLPFASQLPSQPTPAELAKLTLAERQKLQQQRRRNDQSELRQLRAWWARRMVESPRPLEEKLVLFWHGHFATEHRTVRNARAMYAQNQLFREHAAGNFGKLLHAIVHDPAMLRYLNNDSNVKGRPNENLAREIMELFAMGEGQGYTEQDIKEGARALTGYTADRRTGAFRFATPAHDTGTKTIFGQAGNYDGDQFVDLILQQPATARFIARKLFVYFAHDNPSAATVEQLARVLRTNNYELAPLLKAIFRSEEFYSDRALGTQVKSPAQLVIGTARTLGLRPADYGTLVAAMRSMGQDLFDPPNVKGWDGGAAWINTNTVFARNNFAAQLVSRGVNLPRAKGAPRRSAATGPIVAGLDLATRLQERQRQTPAAVVDDLVRALFAVPLSEPRRVELLEFLGPLPPAAEWADRRREINGKLAGLLVLMLSMPEYQVT